MGRAAYCLGLPGVYFLLLTVSSAWAATQPVIFFACVNAQTGFLYNQYKGTHPRCRPGDTVTSWNQAGPRGVQGPPGPPGGEAPCFPDSVQVGQLCVDTFEASVWETTDAETIKEIRAGNIKSGNDLAGVATQRGQDADDYDAAGCPDTGNGCTRVYAVSLAGVIPARFISWFQAAAACRNAGKRLLTNAEWQMAALGTPDPGLGGDGVTTCNTNKAEVVPTGSTGNCISDVGAFDMVGNVWEWVADWVPQSTACPGWGGFSDDDMCLGGASTTSGPGALIRGGTFGTGTSAGVFAVHATDTPSLTNPATSLPTQGFRCARLK